VSVPRLLLSLELYPQLLGEAWWTLAEPVRRAHAVGEEKRGCFRVRQGAGWLARRLAQWSRLPRPAVAADTQLRIIHEGTGQRWERHFSGEAFTTRQWAEEGGRLVERFGAWELSFDLQVQEATLCYVQRAARLCLGAWRLSLPRACSPVVAATEAGDGPTQVRVAVTVTLPLVGLLVAYDGHLDVGGPVP